MSETPATVHVDGDRAPGAVAGHFTMQAVIQKARANGAATGFTKRSNHFGAAAHFAMMALPHRMIGFAATNAGPTMFPCGGRQRIVGNNPFAFAIPAAGERPIVLDMAMSVSAYLRRKRVDAARRGPNAARRDFGPPTGKWRKNRDFYSVGVVHLSLRPPTSLPT